MIQLYPNQPAGFIKPLVFSWRELRKLNLSNDGRESGSSQRMMEISFPFGWLFWPNGGQPLCAPQTMAKAAVHGPADGFFGSLSPASC
jgi:hypothetical protein